MTKTSPPVRALLNNDDGTSITFKPIAVGDRWEIWTYNDHQQKQRCVASISQEAVAEADVRGEDLLEEMIQAAIEEERLLEGKH